MLFRLLRPLALFAVRQYFRDVHVKGRTCESGPLIIVANHPNVMLDALLVARCYQRELWFLAKATIFRGVWLDWLLRSLHLVPLYRRQDRPNDMHKNEEVFRLIIDRLRLDAAVLIFPEGQSFAARKLLPIKTGAARIALQAEAEAGFGLGLKVQPVGITYSDFFRFNSSVTVEAGPPLAIADYAEAHRDDPVKAVRALSSAIQTGLQAVTVEVAEQTALVEKIAKLYRSTAGKSADDQERLRAVSANVTRILPSNPERLAGLEQRLTLYLRLSHALKLDGSENLDSDLGRLFMFLCGPFVLLGVFLHVIPFRLAVSISRRSAVRPSQYSSWGLSAGFFLFPLWYLLFGGVCWQLTGELRPGLYAMLLMAVSGYYARKYFHQFALFVFDTFWPAARSPVDVLREMRTALTAELEELRVE